MQGWIARLLAGCVLACAVPTPSTGYWNNAESTQRTFTGRERVIVKLRADALTGFRRTHSGYLADALPALDAVNKRYGVASQYWLFPGATEQRRPDDLKNVLIVEVPDGVEPAALIADYQNIDEVVYAEPDWPFEFLGAPSDPLYPHEWALSNTGQGYWHVLRRDDCLNDSLVIE